MEAIEIADLRRKGDGSRQRIDVEHPSPGGGPKFQNQGDVGFPPTERRFH
jgi:hypothetical protein